MSSSNKLLAEREEDISECIEDKNSKIQANKEQVRDSKDHEWLQCTVSVYQRNCFLAIIKICLENVYLDTWKWRLNAETFKKWRICTTSSYIASQLVLHHNCHGSMVMMLQTSYCMAAHTTWKLLACDVKASYGTSLVFWHYSSAAMT